jgi:DNA polymerase I-like protein with 3'-5' exonuclease and polymerase domains
LEVSQSEAAAIRDSVMGAMPLVGVFSERVKQIGRDHRKILTVAGRIIPVPESTYNGRVSVAAHKAVNYTVQGGALDIMIDALVRIDDAGLGGAVSLVVHDEVVCNEEAAEDIRRLMEIPSERFALLSGRVPIVRTDSEVLGERWASC